MVKMLWKVCKMRQWLTVWLLLTPRCTVTFSSCLHGSLNGHCRMYLPMRANNTNNFVERAMRLLKDSVLQSTKAFNVPQLVDFIITRFNAHYQRHLQDVANNRLDGMRMSRFIATSAKIDNSQIKVISSTEYEVPSEKQPGVVYNVDMFLGLCTFPGQHWWSL